MRYEVSGDPMVIATIDVSRWSTPRQLKVLSHERMSVHCWVPAVENHLRTENVKTEKF